jgi:hypothetical protein
MSVRYPYYFLADMSGARSTEGEITGKVPSNAVFGGGVEYYGTSTTYPGNAHD